MAVAAQIDPRVRSQVLAQYELLDSPPDAALEDLARVARLVCGASSAFIALLDADRAVFKAFVGLNPAELPKDVPASLFLNLSDEPVLIEDAERRIPAD